MLLSQRRARDKQVSDDRKRISQAWNSSSDDMSKKALAAEW